MKPAPAGQQPTAAPVTPAAGAYVHVRVGHCHIAIPVDQVREALNDVAGSASEAAGNVYSQGERYARQAREQYPEAERYIREGQQAVTHRVTESPLLALFVAGAIGYALAWLIHGQRRGPDEHVPEYGRTNQGYAPHRDEQRRH